MDERDVHLTVTRGTVPERSKDHARAVVARVADKISEPVLSARVSLAMEADPALERPAIAKATLDIDGQPIRAHVAARHLDEAIDALEECLTGRLAHYAEHNRALRHETGLPEPGEWRHGDLPTHRPAYYPRPADEREIVRHKTFTLDAISPDEAVFDMDMLVHDFRLFIDTDTGVDSVVHRIGNGTYGLSVAGVVRDTRDGAPPFVVEAPPPTLSREAAVERLDDGGEPFVFFVDAQSGRGHVLYRRYDGHYGLITPATG